MGPGRLTKRSAKAPPAPPTPSKMRRTRNGAVAASLITVEDDEENSSDIEVPQPVDWPTSGPKLTYGPLPEHMYDHVRCAEASHSLLPI